MDLYLPLDLLFRDRLQDLYYAGLIVENVGSFENLRATNSRVNNKNVEWGRGNGRTSEYFPPPTLRMTSYLLGSFH